MDWVVSRCGMNMENVMDEGCIRMRGLPYGCTKEEVASFFSGTSLHHLKSRSVNPFRKFMYFILQNSSYINGCLLCCSEFILYVLFF